MTVAVVAASAAAALALPLSPVLFGASRTAPLRGVIAGAIGVVAALAFFLPQVAALALVALGMLGWAGLLVRRRRARRAARQVAVRVLETCELLAAELASGQAPGQSLGRAAQSWPPLRPAAEAHELSGDAPAAARDPPGGSRPPLRRGRLGGVQQIGAGTRRQRPPVRRRPA
jgi:tight adherence protein B